MLAMASWRRQAEISLGSRRCLIVIHLLLPLLLVASINGLELPLQHPKAAGGEIGKRATQLATSTTNTNANPDPQDLDTTINQQASCDLLISANNNIGSYCQCKDTEYSNELNSLNNNVDGQENPTSSSSNLNSNSDGGGQSNNLLLQINQLNCYPQNFSQIIEDLTQYLALNFSFQIQIDYLSINTNLTQKKSSLGVQSKSINRLGLLIDHISLQLTYSATNSRSTPDHHGKTIDSGAKSRAIEEQMIDFVHLINETHLQFLSIFLEDNSSGSSGSVYNNNKFDQQLNSGNGNGTGRRFGDTAAATRGGSGSGSGIKFARLLAILTGLSRLELSLGQKGGNELLLESGTLKEQGRLRWLNLASNGQVVFETNTARRSPFTYLPNLEYLSLESCNLESFPLYSLFTIPLQVGGPTTVSTRGGGGNFNNISTKLHYYGLPNLASLNLAGNRLTSFEDDFFTRIANTNEDEELSQSMPTKACYEKHDNNSKRFTLFHLPALTQLDLSHNRLRDITFKAGQYILCSMPNLNQLYLQHNRIVNLNLNSLLTNPIKMPYPFQVASINNNNNNETTNYKLQVDTFSQLEHIDLSHNCLSKITAIQWVGNTTSLTRVKSINLSHNKLQQPTIPLDPKLINRLIFKESFDPIGGGAGPEILSLEHLESFLTLYSMELASIDSICDFLSPASIRSPVNNDLLNELLLTNNELAHIDSNYFSSTQCKDIQILRLSKNRIESLAPDALFELRNLEQLDLSNNLISHLKEETFMKNIRLRTLDLSFNRISLIERNLFLHLTELESLSLSDNQLFALPDELFNHNNQLEIIDLSNNKLNHLYDSFFYHSKYLRRLNLLGNHLKKFSHQAFELTVGFNDAYKDVTTISIANSASPVSSFKSLPATSNNKRFNANLKTQKLPKRRHNRQITEDATVLVLAFNQVDSIQFEKCVQFGQNIQLLRLNNNRLRELHDTSFKCFRSVQRLHLNSNRIRYIGDLTFHHLAQLEYLDLSGNMLSQVQTDSFRFSNALSHIDLSFNQLVDFKFINSFASLRDTNASRELVPMKVVKLGENPDLTLDSDDLISFIGRVDLRQIELGNIGRIESSKKESIISAPMKVERSHIQLLNLSSINLIKESLLTSLSEPTVLIERIDMSHSTILSNKLIDFLRKKMRHELIELNIGGNQYGTSQVAQVFDSLDTTYQLQVLNITNNLVEYWPFNSRIASKLHKLRTIDLSQNKLRQFVRDETNNYVFPELELLNLSSNALVSLADNLKQRMIYLKNLMPRIKQLDLSNNRLTWIPLQFLDDLQELTWLKLNNNQLESLSPILTSQRMVLDLSSNNKLRAMNGGLELNAYQTDLIDGENLILFDDHNNDNNDNWTPRMECQTIEDYIEAHREPYRLQMTASDHQETTFLEWNVMSDDERVNDDSCQSLIQSIDSIILDSISGLINLNSIQTVGSKFIHLSLRHLGLGRIETSDRNSNIVLLDLSHNKMHDLPSTMCRDLIELRSLDLSNNQLNVIPNEMNSLCQKLNYLNLAHNRITSLVAKVDSSDNLNPSALLVINLNNNMLRDLHGMDSKNFQSLRFLDLRNNHLKSDSSIPKLYSTHLLLSSPSYMKNPNDTIIKPLLEISDSFLLIDDQKVSSAKKQFAGHSVNLYDMGGDNNSIAYYPESHRHLIKFCALNITSDHIKVCVGGERDRSNEVQCFLLKVSANVPSCLTYLHEPSNSSKANNIDSNSTITNSSLSLIRRDSLDSLETDADPILSFIDSLKSYWLKLRDMDINDYLASMINVRNDSIYTIMDGRYTIYTLTLVKLSIVGGSVCIVALLIAMFALLTCRSTDQDQLSPKSHSELTNVLNTDSDATDSSMTNNSGNSNNLITSSHTQRSSSPAPATCSSARSKSTSENDEETLKNTILERKTSIHQQLDTNQLMLQNQACSTPSSSLAPSSVETAETLQAIDSIKSGTPIQHFGCGPTKSGSVDQYAESINNPVGNLHPQYQVATVMRMVKSNSANQFDLSNRTSSRGQFNGHSTYGTLNHRQPNYPTLKSKLRAIYENQQQKQHQIHPTTSGQSQQTLDSSQNNLNQQQQQNSYGYVQPTTYYIAQEDNDLMMMNLPEMNHQISQQQDPTNVSLLSINTALPTNHHQHHHSNQPGINQQFLQDTYMDTLESSNSHIPSLCQYHRLVHESGVPSDATGLIGLERHEEEQYSNNEDLAMMNNLPPPPSSRVIEALENTINNMSTNASREIHFSHN